MQKPATDNRSGPWRRNRGGTISSCFHGGLWTANTLQKFCHLAHHNPSPKIHILVLYPQRHEGTDGIDTPMLRRERYSRRNSTPCASALVMRPLSTAASNALSKY